MTHDGEFVQTWLSIEQSDVTVDHMSLDYITHTQAVGNSSSVPKLQILLEPIATCSNVVGTWVDITTIPNRLLEPVDVMSCDAFGICQDLGDPLGHRNFVDPQVGIRRDDGTTREVNTLSGEVTAEAALLAL